MKGLALVWILAAPALAGGQEIQINTVTTGYQRNVRAAVAGGGFVVVWDSTVADGNGAGVVGQRFDAAAQPIGGEFLINTHTTDSQFRPDIAADPGGRFVVVWESFQDGSYSSVHGQRFDAQGQPAGGEFQVNAFTTSFQRAPRVAVAPDGGFVVIWQSSGQDDGRIRARLYDGVGDPIGDGFPVDPSPGGAHPAVAGGADGDFVVVWTDYYDEAATDIFGHRFDAEGIPVGSRFKVNDYTTGYQRYPSVAVAEDGTFIVVWSSLYTDGDSFGVFGQRFDTNAAPQGNVFRVNSYTTSAQGLRPVVEAADHGFRVAWESDGQDGSSWGVVSRWIDRQGVEVGPEAVVNTYTTGTQWMPAVLGEGDASYVFWASVGQDGDVDGVFGRRLATPVFVDGFESGDTSAWSQQSPP